MEQFHALKANQFVDSGYNNIVAQYKNIVTQYKDTALGVERDLSNRILDIRVEVDRLLLSRSTPRKRNNEDNGRSSKRPKNKNSPPPRGGKKQQHNRGHRQ